MGAFFAKKNLHFLIDIFQKQVFTLKAMNDIIELQ